MLLAAGWAMGVPVGVGAVAGGGAAVVVVMVVVMVVAAVLQPATMGHRGSCSRSSPNRCWREWRS